MEPDNPLIGKFIELCVDFIVLKQSFLKKPKTKQKIRMVFGSEQNSGRIQTFLIFQLRSKQQESDVNDYYVAIVVK